MKVYGYNITNNDGFWHGNESISCLFNNKKERDVAI